MLELSLHLQIRARSTARKSIIWLCKVKMELEVTMMSPVLWYPKPMQLSSGSYC